MSATPGRTTRDLRLDGLRGLLLVIMALNHITTDLRVFTEHPLGFVSAAEGFVFLAGLVAGFVFTRRRLRDGAKAAQTAAWRRARTIYWAHLGLLAFVCAWVVGFKAIAGTPPGNAPDLLLISPVAGLLAGPFLMYQPPLLDILPLYTGFMLLLPALLAAYARGHRATVVGASFGLWALTNALISVDLSQPGLFFTGAFNPFAWQLLFVVGSALGDAWARGETAVRADRPGLVAAALAISIGCFLVRHAFVPSFVPGAVLQTLENKNILAPLRLLNL
ncbi:MAG TPA: OpgC domain-containing protein, partial [Opitutaceae bacterium]